MAVEHFVSITHTFAASGGAAVVIEISEERDTVRITCQFARHANWIGLTVGELGKLVEIFTELGPGSEELAELFAEAASVFGADTDVPTKTKAPSIAGRSKP
jgi:hypothetical protein